MPLHQSGLEFCFGIAFEDVPKAVVGLAVTIVQGNQKSGEFFIRRDFCQLECLVVRL